MLATSSHTSFARWHASALAPRHAAHWTLDAATERVLTEGVDARLELNEDGVNAYGCGPRPDPLIRAFGSCTASVISANGFSAARDLYARLRAHPQTSGTQAERIRADILRLSGASQAGECRVLLGASGTDVHRLAADLVAGHDGAPVRAVIAEPSETGSGVPEALSDGCAPLAVALRHADGSLRLADSVDADFVAQVQRVLDNGGRCLLVLTDVSKTGLMAPSAACASQLQQRYAEQVEVMVDACQFRLSPASLCAYLEQGFMVAITGSKFVTGPAFCGALLLPPQSPAHPLAAHLESKPHWGLMLRWEAALAELRQFRQVPSPYVMNFLQSWGRAVAQRIEKDRHFSAVPVAPLRRGATGERASWDSVQTIFPFLVHNARVLSREQTAAVCQQMREIDGSFTWVSTTQNAYNTRFALGQPVAVGRRAGEAVSALRMCVSSRWVAESAQRGQGPEQAISQAMLAFDKLAWLAQRAGA